MAIRPNWTTLGLSALGGVFYFLGFAGFGLWPFALVALVPLLAALERVRDDGWKQTALVGFVYGFVTYTGGYHWLVTFLKTFSGYGWVMSALFGTIFFAYMALQFVVFGLLYRGARRRGWSVALTVVPVLLVVEWLFPLLFPTYLANGFHEKLVFIQVVDLGGPMLVSAVVAVVNIAVFETFRWRTRRREHPTRLWAVLGTCLLAVFGYGSWRMNAIDDLAEQAPALTIGMVQVNMGIFAKRKEAIEGHRRHVEQSRELEKAHELDLLVWPESAYVRYLPRDLPFDAQHVRVDLESPILFGGLSAQKGDTRRLVYNTAFLMDVEGAVIDTYDKIHLLAFGEYLPFGKMFPVLYELSPNSGRFERGAHVEALNFGPWRIATPICYEDVLPGFMRKMMNASAPHLIVNLTNDAWFGNTQEPWIHLAIARLRAIEHRRYFVRSTNSGVSAVIDPVGRMVAQTAVGERTNVVATVRMLDQPTFYSLVGDWPAWIGACAIAWMLMRQRRSLIDE